MSGTARALTIRVLRITMQKTSDAVLLKLEGSVRGRGWKSCERPGLTSAKMAAGEPVSIDLGAVSFIDARGRDLLLRMRREGASL